MGIPKLERTVAAYQRWHDVLRELDVECGITDPDIATPPPRLYHGEVVGSGNLGWDSTGIPWLDRALRMKEYQPDAGWMK